MKENLAFFQVALKTFHSTGSFCPTSGIAAKAMLTNLNQKKFTNCRILEIGPGTGSITRRLIEILDPNTELTICEINPDFMNYLKKELSTKEAFKRNKDRASFFLGPIQELQSEKPFDYIVCALPFLNFNLKLTQEIYNKILNLSHENTLMSFYQYIGIKGVRKIFTSKKDHEGLLGVTAFLKKEKEKRLLSKKDVWLNVFPITVFTLDMNPNL